MFDVIVFTGVDDTPVVLGSYESRQQAEDALILFESEVTNTQDTFDIWERDLTTKEKQ